jgi:hypothetical protein
MCLQRFPYLFDKQWDNRSFVACPHALRTPSRSARRQEKNDKQKSTSTKTLAVEARSENILREDTRFDVPEVLSDGTGFHIHLLGDVVVGCLPWRFVVPEADRRF